MHVKPKVYPFVWFVFLLILMAGIIVVTSHARRQQIPASEEKLPLSGGSLRGYTMMLITFPRYDTFEEYLSVSRLQEADRSRRYPQQPLLNYTNMRLPENVWQPLQQIYREWCTTPPPFPKGIDTEQLYRIAVDCQRATNPIVYLTADQLPPAIRVLLDTVPPPPTPEPR